MNKEEIEELKDFTIDLTDIDELALGLEVCSKKSNMVIQEFADTIIQLQQENKQLKEQLDYLRSGEYYNQLRFERDMLQDLVDKMEISKEDKEFIDCTHRNTELLEELEEEKRINVEDLKTIDRQQEIIQELKADYGNKAQVERDLLLQENKKYKEVIDKLKAWEQTHTILVYTKKAPRQLVGTHELLHLLYDEDKEVE